MDILRQIKKDLYYMEVYDMSDFFQDVFNKTKKFANNAVDETKDAAQKAKLNNKISNEVQMIDRNMVEIGKYFYEQNKENPPQELLQYFNNVKVLQDSIAISRSEIQNIDNAMAARKQADMNPNQSPNQNYNQNPNNNQNKGNGQF